MIKLNIADLKSGMITAQPVRNCQGVLLLEAGAKISKKNIRIFKSWGISEILIKGEPANVESKINDTEIRVEETLEQVEHLRYEYAALVSMCDAYLGKVLDTMDELDLWDDTLLIVNTDHGFLLGEHDWWAKCVQPFYNEIAHVPLFIWDPRCRCQGERRQALVQTVDLAPTLLEYFGVERPADMQGAPLADSVASDATVREAGLFGLHGGHVNCTDGRYLYMRVPVREENEPLYNYTLMPTHMKGFFGPDELTDIELAEPFTFTKGYRTIRARARNWGIPPGQGHLLFDLENDPAQEHPLEDERLEARMIEMLVALMKENDAPGEQYQRVGLR